MDLDPVLMSRIQFAFVISFHALFPAFTIGLAAFIAVMETLHARSGNPLYLRLSTFWTKIFAVSFAMGVVSGIVMSFQFGTNWSGLSYIGANILGPLLSYEVITAFFLEATFLGVLLFGRDKVPAGMHLFAAWMVALGTLISSFWILAANSFMQTPDGAVLENGRLVVESWTATIFNPSFPYRLAHMVTGSFLTTAFFVLGVSAWYLLKDQNVEPARRAFSMTLWLVLILAPAQAIIGDMHGLNTLEYQPAKIAAMEGAWETVEGAPLLLFAWPNQTEAVNAYELGIPGMASFILTHDLSGEIRGLSEWAPEDRPYVPAVFWAFRTMVGIGLLMIAVALTGLFLRRGGRIYTSRFFHRFCVLMLPAGFIAVLAGWITTEMGRFPWAVYDTLRLEDAVTPSLTGDMVAFSLAAYVLAYAAIFAGGGYYIFRIVKLGPDEEGDEQPSSVRRHPKRPLSAADAAYDPAE